MLAVPSVSPISSLAAYLNTAQTIVNAGLTYDDKINRAKNNWKALNRSTNPSFRQVRELLAQLHGDLERCAYCEDSLGHQIEHIYPKSLFPSVVFSWENFLHACGSCNGTKLAKFAVLHPLGVVELSSRTPPTAELPASNALLINPRVENPLDFMILDLRDTFQFIPTGHFSERADYTIEVLQLNHRAGLVAARKTALALYRSSLAEYDREKATQARPSVLKEIAQRISCKISHRTVWEEVKRQYLRAPWLAEFRHLIGSNPEALNW